MRLARLCLILPPLSIGYVFSTRNWLHGPICVRNILHYYFNFIAPVKSAEWAEPYTMCVDPYWANQWLKNYGAGFAKRGLLGEIAVNTFGGKLNFLHLNLVAFLTILFIAYGIIALLSKLGNQQSLLNAIVFTCLLWFTPFGKALTETAGDPLQIIAAGLISLVLAKDRWKLHGFTLDLCLSTLYCASILIHEGSFLLLLPAFLLIGRRSWAWWLGLGMAMTIALFFSAAEMVESQSLIESRLTGFNPFTNLEMSYRAGGGIASQVSFASNLKMEFSRYIKNPSEVVGETFRTFSMTIFFCFCFVCWLQQYSLSNGSRFFRYWLLYIPLTLPFFLVTHDWVRYGVINLVTCLCCTLCQSSENHGSERVSSLAALRLGPGLLRALPAISLVLLAIIVKPHLNHKDIRTHPHPRLGSKYAVLAMGSAALAATQRRPFEHFSF